MQVWIGVIITSIPTSAITVFVTKNLPPLIKWHFSEKKELKERRRTLISEARKAVTDAERLSRRLSYNMHGSTTKDHPDAYLNLQRDPRYLNIEPYIGHICCDNYVIKAGSPYSAPLRAVLGTLESLERKWKL